LQSPGNSRAALDWTAEAAVPTYGAKGTWLTERKADFFTVSEIDAQRAARNKLYQEFLRVPAMSAGLYVLPAGAADPQRPHHEDEMYYVVRGRGRFRAGDEDREVSAGSLLFVAAEVEHRFYDIREELVVLVFFAPAES
jgi:mannose-6-phosphate isomerase-like protein (cupin superfamily)